MDSFCNGVVFSRTRLEVGAMYSLEVSTGGDWSGALRLGVTTVPHSRRPQPPPRSVSEYKSLKRTSDDLRYACPDLIAREGYWARPVKESLATHGTRISFCVCPGGEMRLFVNNHHVGRHLAGLPVSEAGDMWALVDVYGSTVAVTSVREEAVPVQVLARGQEAVRAFLAAQRQGTLPLYSARVTVVGQERDRSMME